MVLQPLYLSLTPTTHLAPARPPANSYTVYETTHNPTPTYTIGTGDWAEPPSCMHSKATHHSLHRRAAAESYDSRLLFWPT